MSDHAAHQVPSDSVMGAGQPLAPGTDLALGDFTVTWRTVALLPLAVVVGGIAACVALGLLDLIGLFTHLAYYGNVGDSLVAPTHHRWGAVAVVIPIIGGLIVGVMARYGSEQIRGHGIPEAMETILIKGSSVQPRLAILKPISSAVSIGSGGPFGAEGPIILTGGAVGSVLAQLFRLAAIERRTLLVAGACAGMAGVFGTPVAAALFGVELLVFEWRPRSFVPIGVACAVAEVIRNVFAAHHLLAASPLFPVPAHGTFGTVGVAEAAAIGVASGLLALVLTTACYGAEDLFTKLPIHWMWWPAIGGAVVGVGGLIDPKALGVGYAVIGGELAGQLALGTLALLLVTKLVMWSVALGSGTSGGILAPLLMMGAALGAIVGHAFGGPVSTWALMGMAGALAGVTRSPLTSIVFAFELTHDTGSLLPLLVVCVIAHLISALILKRSILTEKVARKGYHVMREYGVDQLESVFVRDVMISEIVTVAADARPETLLRTLESDPIVRRQRLYPVMAADGSLSGVVGWSDLTAAAERPDARVADVAHRHPITATPDETLRLAADRMADHYLGALPVVDPATGRLEGVVTYFELLAGRRRQLVEEHRRERRLHLVRANSRTQGRSSVSMADAADLPLNGSDGAARP
ncbi:MAG TPA: chloride channel protein [Acidimicrobiales bacterium]|jgi:H+/Cl- antiporter ClcA|nr:chloride channel protein [Acidimicrobiales bacterium]